MEVNISKSHIKRGTNNMSDIPASLRDMTQPDDKEYVSKPKGAGIETGKPLTELNESDMADIRARSVNASRARGVFQEEDIPGFKPGFEEENERRRAMNRGSVGAMDGRIDPVFGKSGLAIGDRIYHKIQKIEGKVTDLSANGKVYVDFDDGRKGKTIKENCVKL